MRRKANDNIVNKDFIGSSFHGIKRFSSIWFLCGNNTLYTIYFYYFIPSSDTTLRQDMTQLLPLQNFPSDLSFLETLGPSLDKKVTKCYKKFLKCWLFKVITLFWCHCQIAFLYLGAYFSIILYNGYKFPNLTTAWVWGWFLFMIFFDVFLSGLASDLSLLLILSQVFSSSLALALGEELGFSLTVATFLWCKRLL